MIVEILSMSYVRCEDCEDASLGQPDVGTGPVQTDLWDASWLVDGEVFMDEDGCPPTCEGFVGCGRVFSCWSEDDHIFLLQEFEC